MATTRESVKFSASDARLLEGVLSASTAEVLLLRAWLKGDRLAGWPLAGALIEGMYTKHGLAFSSAGERCSFDVSSPVYVEVYGPYEGLLTPTAIVAATLYALKSPPSAPPGE